MREITLIEKYGFSRTAESVHVSLPCSKGEFRPDTHFEIIDEKGSASPVQTTILAFWPDGSIKWLRLVFFADIDAGTTRNYFLNATKTPRPLYDQPKITMTQQGGSVIVNTGKATFTLSDEICAPLKAVRVDGEKRLSENTGGCFLTEQNGNLSLPLISEVSVEETGPLYAVVKSRGTFTGSDLRFTARIHFWACTAAVKLQFTVHNPNPARHPQGLWDLGDPGSVLFKGLVFDFPLCALQNEMISFSTEATEPLCALDPGKRLRIYQESSGGDQWQSSNHRNRDGHVPLQRCGFIVEYAATETVSGRRATPTIRVGNDQTGMAVHVPLFWQEFPNELSYGHGTLQVALFPECFPDRYELQGGEQKTKNICLDFSATDHPLLWARCPIQSSIPETDYRKSGICNELPGVDDLVDQITSVQELLDKREIIDEYGWRSFGDVYADHEAVQNVERRPLISHYNNQYDLIAGYYRKYFASGDHRWQELAADLAQHVADIDIYHTDLDREEYNHGLFWHTDHYADAGLSTHRSYSKEQKATYALHSGGGGPGSEHCYTSGLLMHYYQTGDPEIKKLVLGLANWELVALSGARTVLAATMRFVTRIKHLQTVGAGTTLFPFYPLTRGTGNCITACLDAFELTQDSKWLTTVEEIIRHSIHPADDISARNLDNVEIAWSYMVFLASLGKYLKVREQCRERDIDFEHGRQSLLSYALWMAEHEYPYLHKPELLEYPNETWAAQELRKSVVFYYAGQYADDPNHKVLFREKARYFYAEAKTELLGHPGSKLTRPVALILQNGWVAQKLDKDWSETLFHNNRVAIPEKATDYFTLNAISRRFFRDVKQALRMTSMKKEIAWLRSRLYP